MRYFVEHIGQGGAQYRYFRVQITERWYPNQDLKMLTLHYSQTLLNALFTYWKN